MKNYKDFEDSMTPEQRAEAEAAYMEARNSIPECLRNLVWADGEMYYVDDEGKRIDKSINVPEVTAALLQNMPKTPLVMNGQEVDRETLLQQELDKTK